MDRPSAIRIVSILFADNPAEGLAPARVDPRALALADADHSGTLTRDEVLTALTVDQVQIETVTQRLVPAIPLSLTRAAPASDTVVGQDSLTMAGAAAPPAAPPAASPTASPTRPLLMANPAMAGPVPVPWMPGNTRPAEPLMMGAIMGRAPSSTITNRGVDLTAPIVRDGTIRLGMHVDTDPLQTKQSGTMLLEEAHPHYLEWHDVAHTGLTLGLDSRTRLDMVGSQIGAALPGSGTPDPMQATIRHEERLHVERQFAVFGRQPDTTVQAGYLLGLGPWQFGGTPGTPSLVPLVQYATVSLATRPIPLLGLNGELYVPVQNGAGARGAHPIARISANLPHLTVGTTQSQDTSRYDASIGLDVPHGVQLAASGAVDHNRLNDQTGFTAGIQFRTNW